MCINSFLLNYCTPRMLICFVFAFKPLLPYFVWKDRNKEYICIHSSTRIKHTASFLFRPELIFTEPWNVFCFLSEFKKLHFARVVRRRLTQILHSAHLPRKSCSYLFRAPRGSFSQIGYSCVKDIFRIDSFETN